MNFKNQLITNELEALLQAKAKQSAIGFLRSFACECSRRVSYLCTYPLVSKLLEFAEERELGSLDNNKLVAMRYDLTCLYDSLYPGYDSPSPVVLALSSVGEAAFTESALTAAVGASSFAADAIATSDGIAVNDDYQYDTVYEAAYQRERQAQLELFDRLESANSESQGK